MDQRENLLDRLHYVKAPMNTIVVDFDTKSVGSNKLDSGIHLHYIYDGDVTKLSLVKDN